MKLIILKTNLIKGIFSVEKSIGSGSNLPILKNILISSKKETGEILITSTNLEIAVTHTISGKIMENGDVTVPLNIFSSIIKNINSERITLESKNDNLLITTENYEATIQGNNSKEFPIIPNILKKKNFIKIQAEDLINSIKEVIIATQFSDIRPEISGVYVGYKNENLFFVATNSFRLSEKKLKLSSILTDLENFSFILPIHTAEEILRIINDSDGEISVFIEQNQVLFSTKTKKIVSRLIDGNFPDYKSIIPKEIKTEIEINRDEFINAIKLISSFSGKTNDMEIKINENKKVAEILSSDGSIGKNKYKIPIKIKGEPVSAVFNWKYILDGLKIYFSEQIIFGINSSDKPAIIKSEKRKDLLYVVMPIRNQ